MASGASEVDAAVYYQEDSRLAVVNDFTGVRANVSAMRPVIVSRPGVYRPIQTSATLRFLGCSEK